MSWMPPGSPERRPVVLGAFATLACVLGGHVVLETARDALFLASIPAAKLPWVYLLVAVLAVTLVTLQRKVGSTSLAVPLVVSGVVTAAFWWALPYLGSAGLYALYAWSGVLGTSIVVQFWVAVGHLFTLQDAKRLFAFIGAGATTGALVGNALAAGISAVADPRHLLLVSAAAFLLGTVPARWLTKPTPQAATPRRQLDADISLGKAFRRPYVRHVAGLVVASTMALTMLDWLFKAAVVQLVPRDQLGLFFAGFYLLLSVVGLAIQVLAVNRVLRGLGITTTLVILPVLVLGGGVWMLLGGAAIAALTAKTLDGSLRHTLHRTSLELLYVPMPDRVRQTVKEVIDIAGQRGGQAVASLTILGLIGFVGPSAVTVAFVLLTVVWIVLVLLLRKPYLDVFRRTLRELVVDVRPDLPALDVSSLEALVETFNSPDDHELLAALAVLEAQGRVRLVPALLLYHPAPEVVETALDMMSGAGRVDFIPIAHRLLGKATPRVHAAIVRAHHAVDPDPAFLLTQLDSFCIATRATAALYAQELGVIDDIEARRRVEEFMASDNPNGRLALAHAAAAVSLPTIPDLLERLAGDSELEVRRHALTAMAAQADPRSAEYFLRSLSEPALRRLGRVSLVRLGAAALPILDVALSDAERWSAVRWQFPRIIAEIDPQRGLSLLLAHLEQQPDGLIEYRIIRALERIHREHTDVSLPVDRLDAVTRNNLGRVLALVSARLDLRGDDSEDGLQLREMLLRLLSDKILHASERLVRLSGLRWQGEDVNRIIRGLWSAHPAVQSSSVEMLEALLPPHLRGVIVALVTSADDEEVLARAPDRRSARQRPPAEVLTDLLSHSSESVRLLARGRLDELRVPEIT